MWAYWAHDSFWAYCLTLTWKRRPRNPNHINFFNPECVRVPTECFHHFCTNFRATTEKKYRSGVRSILMPPNFHIEPYHWLCLSLTHWLTDSCLVNLIDVTLACEDDNSNLLRLLLLLMLMMRNVLTTVWCRFWSWSLVIFLLLMLGCG